MFIRPLLLAAALVTPTLAIAPLAHAQEKSAVEGAHEAARLRGTVAAIDGATVTLSTLEGGSATATMTEDYFVFVYRPITAADLQPGDFLSIPSVTGPNGEKLALSINVFPEEFRGVNEGVNPWDITEDSLMTNATIGTVNSAGDGSVIEVTYNNVTEEIVVPEQSPITRFAPEPGRKLKVGDNAIILGSQGPDGTVTSGVAGVNADGTMPTI